VNINAGYREDRFVRSGATKSRLEVEWGERVIISIGLFQIYRWEALLSLFRRRHLVCSSQMEIRKILDIIVFFLVDYIAWVKCRWDGEATSGVFRSPLSMIWLKFW
jgi:hypothetical protein